MKRRTHEKERAEGHAANSEALLGPTLQTPDSPESAALFKAREGTQESQQRDDGGLAALPKTGMLHRLLRHLLHRKGLAAPLPPPPRRLSNPRSLASHPRQAQAGQDAGRRPRGSQGSFPFFLKCSATHIHPGRATAPPSEHGLNPAQQRRGG